jgi:Protein of unknown function (DUF2778)
MAFDAATAVRRVPRRRRGWFASTTLALFSVTVSLAAAAWVTNSDLFAFASAALPGNAERTGSFASFEDRFFPQSLTPPAAVRAQLQPLDQSTVAALQMKFRGQDGMGPQQIPPDFRLGLTEGSKVDETRPVTSTGVPLPRSRPAAADTVAAAGPAPGQALALAQTDSPARPAERSLVQKLSDFGRVTLASLTPDGLFRRKGPDLAALGYDGVTAVYDIKAHAVYLPSGVVLEAHSGMGSMRDDLDHVNVPMTGATPPAEYELKPRERIFHGVAALRMTPVEGSDIYGRSGLLVHSYMLGTNGDSNGCVSIKDYDRFLKAYNDGEVNRLVVIPSLSGATVATQRASQQS